MQSAIERELTGLEKKYWQALVDRNIEAALEMTADPCIVTGAQGVSSIGHKEFRQMMKSDTSTLEHFDLDDMKVHQLTDDTAVVAYKVRERMTVDGKPLTLEAADASTWVRKNGKWLCALHTESLTGDPFGRDRKAAPAATAG